MPEDDFKLLLDAVLPFAQSLLRKHGEFFPFGAAMWTNGGIEQAAAQTDEEQPQSIELMNMLADGFESQASRGEIRATAICFDVLRVPPGETEKIDSICVNLEHVGGVARLVYFPYRRGWFGGITYRQPYSIEDSPKIFTKG